MRTLSNEVIQKEEPKKVVTGKPVIHNIIIADASGSMSGSKYNTSISSIRKELELLIKDENITYKHTLVEFNSWRAVTKHFFNSENININFINIGADGGTPLYNTIGKVLTELQEVILPEERVLVKIFTDGEDTDYGKGVWNNNSIGVFLNKLINVNNWTITFNCTLADKQNILKMNIPESNILCHNNTAEDIARVSNLRMESTAFYSKQVSRGVSASVLKEDFYSKSLN